MQAKPRRMTQAGFNVCLLTDLLAVRQSSALLPHVPPILRHVAILTARLRKRAHAPSIASIPDGRMHNPITGELP